MCPLMVAVPIFFFFNDTATTEIYTLSLHDALPISFRDPRGGLMTEVKGTSGLLRSVKLHVDDTGGSRSEEHTSELQSRQYLVCRLLLEKKKTTTPPSTATSLHHLRALMTSLPHTAP